LDFLNFTKEKAVALYRYALLLSGSTQGAVAVMSAVVEECAPKLAELRNEKSGLVFLIKKLREKCMKNGGSQPAAVEDTGDEVLIQAGRFSRLPEPERSALALIYLDFFPATETAALLGMELEELSNVIGGARELLWQMESAPSPIED
jgi:hypothetical protein